MKLAIKGHPKRGKEVIELLEMLGGVDWHGFAGNILDSVYYISESRAISCDNTYDIVFEDGIKEFITFTLEEFEQKFPYKVGDKVNYVKYNDEYPNVYTIQKMWWNGVTIEYVLDSSGFSALTKDLQPYKEQITETHKTQKEVNIYLQDTTIKNAQNLLDIEQHLNKDGLELPNNIVINKNGIDVFEFTKWYNKPQYPKTYEECCEVLGCKANHFFTDFSYNGCDVEISDYEDKINDLLQNFRKLRYCRDAYWKIAGEQIELGKPWEPDWSSFSEGVYPTITKCNGRIIKTSIYTNDSFLAFPTEEIRDTFYENFKKDIEKCKEFL